MITLGFYNFTILKRTNKNTKSLSRFGVAAASSLCLRAPGGIRCVCSLVYLILWALSVASGCSVLAAGGVVGAWWSGGRSFKPGGLQSAVCYAPTANTQIARHSLNTVWTAHIIDNKPSREYNTRRVPERGVQHKNDAPLRTNVDSCRCPRCGSRRGVPPPPAAIAAAASCSHSRPKLVVLREGCREPFRQEGL